jgi:shikimate kinase
MVITLIGYRGTGKTTVGAELAGRLGWEFVDTDSLIEQRAGKSIAEIFAEEGEPRFRNLERSIVREQLARDRVVLSVGGGAVLDEANRQAIRQAGPAVWLQASTDMIVARITADPASDRQRPALSAQKDLRDEVTLLLARREPLYDDTATIRIETDGRTPAAIVDEILAQLPTD